MSDSLPQKDNLADILNRVSEKVSTSDARSLWEKLRQEMQSGGPDAASKYVSAELDRCKQEFETELSRLRAENVRRG
jgi:hypothetical protein